MKLPCEANIVACLYKQPELFLEYDKIALDDFSFNEWRVFWTIGKEISKEGKPILDELTIGFYLEKHLKLKAKYDEYGGWNAIDSAKAYVNVENLDGYIQELYKWNSILKLIGKSFPVTGADIKEFKDMSLEDIYNRYEANLNDTFINVESRIKSYNACEGLKPLIDKCNEGLKMGLPLNNSPILNDTIGGNMEGNITLFGGLSGTGKTTLTIEYILPSILQKNEQVVMVINEQDEEKIKKELITWIINNVFEKEFNKKRFRQGHFTPEELKLLYDAADWLEQKKNNHNITIIPLETYTVDIMKKIIRKYSAMGVKNFILDTFKASDGANTENLWLEMMLDMRKLYDCIKPSNKNVHLWCTLQLKKDKVASRYLTVDHIGMSKNVVDVCSTVLLMRGVRDDEKEGGANELKVYRLEGKGTKIPVTLDKNKHYCIIFPDKNREGTSKEFQIVAESNLGCNTYKEIGITNVPEDF